MPTKNTKKPSSSANFKIKKIGGPETDVHHSLKNIYQDKKARYSDISRLDRKKRNWLTTFTIVAIILLAIFAGLAYLSFYIFNKPADTDESNVTLTIEGPEEVQSGDEVEYIISFTNKNQVALQSAEVEVLYPEGFVFKESEPAIESDKARANVWLSSNIGAGATSEIIISGQMIGTAESQKNLSATLTYKPANFNSEFKEVAFHALTIKALALEVEFDGPSRAVSEKEVTYEIEYTNSSTLDLKDLQLKLNMPTSFEITEIEPEEMQTNYILKVDKLKKKEKDKIIVSGEFKKGATGEQEIKLEISLKGEGGDYHKQAEKTMTTKIISDGLSLNLIVNGSEEDKSIGMGDSLHYSIVYKNAGEDSLKDVSISASIVSEIVDWDTLEDSNEGEFLVNEIIWTREEVPELVMIDAGEEGTIDFKVGLLSKTELFSFDNGELLIESQVEAVIGQTGDIKEETTLKSNKIVNTIYSDFGLRAEARYFSSEGTTVGEGPLPPEVGSKTEYRMYWYLENSLHELDDVLVNMTLPDYIEWSSDFNVTAGELRYNSKTRVVSWSVNWMPLDVGVLAADFAISLTPTSDDADKILVLSNKVNAEALDVETNDTIYKEFKALTTDLEFDSLASGKGVIVE